MVTLLEYSSDAVEGWPQARDAKALGRDTDRIKPYGGGPVVATHFSVEHLLAARLILP